MQNNNDQNNWGLSNFFQINFQELARNEILKNVQEFSEKTIDDLTKPTKEVEKIVKSALSVIDEKTNQLTEISNNFSENITNITTTTNNTIQEATQNIKIFGDTLKTEFDKIVAPEKIEVKSSLKLPDKPQELSRSASQSFLKTSSIDDNRSSTATEDNSISSKADSKQSKTSSIFSRAKSIFSYGKQSSIGSNNSSDSSAPLSRAPSIAGSNHSNSSTTSILSSAFKMARSGLERAKSGLNSTKSELKGMLSKSSSTNSLDSSSASSSKSSSISPSRSSSISSLESSSRKPSFLSRSLSKISDIRSGKNPITFWTRQTNRFGETVFQAEVPLTAPRFSSNGFISGFRKKTTSFTRNASKVLNNFCENLPSTSNFNSSISSSSLSNGISSMSARIIKASSSISPTNFKDSISTGFSKARSSFPSFGTNNSRWSSFNSGLSSVRDSFTSNTEDLRSAFRGIHYNRGGSRYSSENLSDVANNASDSISRGFRDAVKFAQKARNSAGGWSAGVRF